MRSTSAINSRPSGAIPTIPARNTGDKNTHASLPFCCAAAIQKCERPATQNREVDTRGHKVTVVSDGRGAIAAVAGNVFDVVLMDVQMPELDGLQATLEIRKSEVGTERHVPIVALTAHAMQSDQQRCLDAGMDDYLTKPIDPVALDRISNAYGRRWPDAEPVERAG